MVGGNHRRKKMTTEHLIIPCSRHLYAITVINGGVTWEAGDNLFTTVACIQRELKNSPSFPACNKKYIID